MKVTCGILIAASLLVSGCNKKAEGGTETTTTGATAKATGISGTYNGKPWAGKVAWLRIDATAAKDSKLYIMAFDGKCKMPDTMGDELGIVQITSNPKKGVTTFDKDNTYGEQFWKKGNSMSSKDTSNGEIEWITIPTATSKGLARIRMQKDPDSKIEGSMEVNLCPAT
jgi:hypothetical protein